MNPFIGNDPDIISQKLFFEIESELNKNLLSFENDDEFFLDIEGFFTEYIKPNLFPLIVILSLVVYLCIRYAIKQSASNDLQNDNVNIINTDIMQVPNSHIQLNNDKLLPHISDEYLLTTDESSK